MSKPPTKETDMQTLAPTASITLTASAAYGCKGQYVAQITGSGSGRFQFEQTFIGQRSGKRQDCTQATVIRPGVYVEGDVGSGGKTRTFYVVWAHPADGLMADVIDETDALVAAQAMDAGTFDPAVVGAAACEEALRHRIRKLEAKIAAWSSTKDTYTRKAGDPVKVVTGGVLAKTHKPGTTIMPAEACATYRLEIERLESEIAALKGPIAALTAEEQALVDAIVALPHDRCAAVRAAIDGQAAS